MPLPPAGAAGVSRTVAFLSGPPVEALKICPSITPVAAAVVAVPWSASPYTAVVRHSASSLPMFMRKNSSLSYLAQTRPEVPRLAALSSNVRCFLVLLWAVAAFAQGTTPKPKPENYDVHATSGNLVLGAEFMVHSFSGEDQMYLAEDFLVVEVALYPPKNTEFAIAAGDFALRLNGKKQLLSPATPQFAASTLSHPEWSGRPNLEGGVGMGDTGVIFGRPKPTQVPGGQGPDTSRMPPRAPAPEDRSGLGKAEVIPAPELLVRTALPEGAQRGPVSGFLYFPWRGNVKSIKTLELIYKDATVKLR
jgi:hypothetical protein